GMTPDDDLLSGVHPDDREAVKALRHQLLHPRDDAPVEVEVRSELGDRVYVCRARAEISPSGRVERYHGTIQDVTEARALERQMREDRRRLADAQQAARLGMWERNPATSEVVWSDRLRELHGLPADAAGSHRGY